MKLHIIPIQGTEPEHAVSQDCWCHPLVDRNRQIIIHHARDCREKWERLGIGLTKRHWKIVEVSNPINARRNSCETV